MKTDKANVKKAAKDVADKIEKVSEKVAETIEKADLKTIAAVKKAPAKKPIKKTEPVKTAPAASAKKEAVKATPAAAVKKEAAKAIPSASAKTETVKATPAASAKTETVKASVKKPETLTKKTTAKSNAKKVEIKETIFLQYLGKEINKEDIIKSVKEVWKSQYKKKISDIKSITIYLKPEENAAYYVINKDITGSVSL